MVVMKTWQEKQWPTRCETQGRVSLHAEILWQNSTLKVNVEPEERQPLTGHEATYLNWKTTEDLFLARTRPTHFRFGPSSINFWSIDLNIGGCTDHSGTWVLGTFCRVFTTRFFQVLESFTGLFFSSAVWYMQTRHWVSPFCALYFLRRNAISKWRRRTKACWRQLRCSVSLQPNLKWK